MNKSICLLLILVGMGCTHRELGGLGFQIKLDQRSLSNGLEVLMIEDHAVPIVSYQSWYKVGSVDEEPGKTGIAHLFEHLMFKGTKKYGPREFFNQLDTRGANVNAFTTRDFTVYHQEFIPELLEKVIDLESDRLTHLVLNKKKLHSERLVTFEERRLRTESSPSGRIQEALWLLAYERHYYRRPVDGYPPDVLKLTVEDLKKFYQEYYQPGNLAVVIIGDFDADKTFALIKKYYGGIKGRKRKERKVPVEPPQLSERRLELTDHIASERFAHAYHITEATNLDSYALDVLAEILFTGTTSRAYRRLVDQADLALAVGGSSFTPTFPGLFFVSAHMKGRTQAEQGEALLQTVIAAVQEKGVTALEVKKAVRQLTIQMVDSVRTPHGMGELVGTVHTILGDASSFTQDLRKYLKVTPADVKRVANKHLDPNNRASVVMRPKTGGSKK